MHDFGRFDTIACVKVNTVLNTPVFNEEIGASEIGVLLEQCKAMSRVHKMNTHTEWLANPDIQSMVPSRELCDILVNLYFRTSESLYRVLHFPSFQREYIQYWEQPSAASISFTLKMLLAMANGVCFYQGPDEEDIRCHCKKWIFAANNWLNTTLTEKSRLNISGLQIHCLLLLARQANGIVGDLVWISTGALLRAAFNMGFHRDPKYFPKMSAMHAELRRRLWATIVELNVQYALDSGMNPLISMDDFDTEAPANINDSDIDETTRGPSVSRPSNEFTQTTVQIVLLKSLPLRIRICRFINDCRFEPSYDEVLELSARISKACKDSVVLIHGASSQDPSVRITQLQRNLLDQSNRRFLLTIHRGFSMKAQSDPRYYFSRKVCLDCAIRITTYPTNEAGTVMAPITDQPRDQWTQFKVSSGGLFKSVIIHSALTIFCELLQQIEEDSPHTEEGASTRAPLKKILRDTIDLAEQRIGVTENNVKGHLFMSALLGQIEALEQGIPPELGALEAAKKSANFCLRLLARRVLIAAGGDVPPPETSEWRFGEAPVVQNGEVDDFGMQDWNMEFEMPDSWLFAGWEENKCW